jgi:hypothetical protein
MISSSAQAGKFVISLCSVAVPISIPQPRSPELMRYRFFLHTSWEEGGRRHQLYMGYFAARDEAEKWLATLRRIYPSAFVAMAPETTTLTNTQIVSLLEHPTPVSTPGAAGVRETTGARPGLQSSAATGARPALRSGDTTGSRPGLRSSETTGTHAGLQPREATGTRPALRAHEARAGAGRLGPSLEDTIAALRASAVDFNDTEDPLSSTGVRHLRIEVQKEAPRPRGEKRSGSRKP